MRGLFLRMRQAVNKDPESAERFRRRALYTDHFIFGALLLIAVYQLAGWLIIEWQGRYTDYMLRKYGVSGAKAFGFFISACLWRCRFHLAQLQKKIFMNESKGGASQFVIGYACGFRDAKLPQKNAPDNNTSAAGVS